MDMKDVLNLALDQAPAPGAQADPRGDLNRGRGLLRRRRMLGAARVAAAMAIGAAVPLTLNSVSAPAARPAAAHKAPVPTPRPAGSARPSIALVAWTGAQPPGYRVSWMPSGWVVQGGTPFALTIAPAGDRDKNQDSFLGKLVVMLQSADASYPPSGVSQPVNGRPGFLESAAQAGGDTEILTFQVAGGQWVQVQAPMVLGWNGAQLAKFAGGVQVLAAAQPGRG